MNEYNKIIQIILILIVILIVSSVMKNNNVEILDDTLLKIPYKIKCFIGEKNCDKGDVGILSLVFLLLFTILGIIYPNKYIIIIFMALFLEIIKPLFGFPSMYIIGTLMNLTGYTIGSLMINHYKSVNYNF